MKILFTNNTLKGRAGTEIYVRDVALSMLRLGHDVAAYSSHLGSVAEELREGGVVVVDRLDAMAWRPDIIHGHHHPDAMTAILHFDDVPAIYVCHGFVPWQEAPPLHPRIVRYLAVDEMTLRAAIQDYGVPSERISLMLNFVDMTRFPVRPRLPDRARRALLFSAHATPRFLVPEVRAGCQLRNVELDVVGDGVGIQTDRPEDVLGQYDLVFAKGRSALEAMACGAAVIVCGVNGIGPMVDTAQFDRLRRMSFGAKSLMKELTPEAVAWEIDRYDAADAARVRRLVRGEARLDRGVQRLLALYRRVIDEFRQTPHIPGVADAASARYLADLARFAKELAGQEASLAKKLDAAEGGMAEAAARLDAVLAELEPARDTAARLSIELEAARTSNQELRGELTAIRSSRSWRMTAPIRVVGRAIRRVMRWLRHLG